MATKRKHSSELGQLDYSSSAMSKMDSFRMEESFCDITIKIGTTSFPAHKVVLSSASDYFYAMFTSGFRESTSSEISVCGEANTFSILLKCAYSGKLPLCPETVIDILSMASYMNFKHAISKCEEYLKRELPKDKFGFDDVFEIASVAEKHNLPEIGKPARDFLAKNFLDYAEAEAFLESETAEFIMECLDREDLVPSEDYCEDEVLVAITNWLRHDWENRKEYAAKMLSKVRLGLVWVPCLKENMDETIQQIAECKKMLDNVLGLIPHGEFCPADEDLSALSHKYPSVFATRSTITTLISTRGSYSTSVGFFADGNLYFCPEKKKWQKFQLAELPHSRFHCHSMIVVDGILYCIGGKISDNDDDDSFDPVGDLKTTSEVYQYDALLNMWDELAHMKAARDSCTLVELDGYIYAIGGFLGWGTETLTSKVERYSVKNMKWEKVASMFDPVISSSAVAFQGKILVFGKYICTSERCDCGQSREMLQIYDPSAKSWHRQLLQTEQTSEVIPVMNTPPVITVQNGMCYLVVYQDADMEKDIPFFLFKRKWHKPLVNRLHVGNTNTVRIGKAESQDLIGENHNGAFIINNQVFVNMKGYVHNTGITTDAEQTGKVDLGPWKSASCTPETVVSFSFDKGRLK